ncbi:MAG: T9SS type A sorting domain-containing protein [Bacteroidetes bacterium]|nr:T9SS type A sorting domain-containing protein [Bacteroidota bacterium]
MLKNTFRSLRVLLFMVFVLSTGHSFAQYTVIGLNSYAGTNIYGPMTPNASSDTFFSRHAYIYPSTVLGRLQHGDTIRSIEFFKSDNNTFSGLPDFKIYIGMSASADFGAGNIHWPNRTKDTGTVLFWSGHPNSIAGNTFGFKRFEYNQSPFIFDTTLGSHLKIMVEFVQYTRQTTPVTWVYENDFSVPQFVSNNETKFISNFGKLSDSTVSSNLRKPYIRLNYPRHGTDLEVNRVYCLGRVPVLMNRADSVFARVANIGLKTVYNHTVYLEVDGVNSFLDSLVIDSLDPSEQKMIVFGSYQPKNQGVETIKVYPATDDDPTSDMDSVQRIVDYNVYSHADPFIGNAGGIGFNGSSGDFVAKFYTDSIIYLNQIKVDFALGGRPFQLGIWNENASGLPGTNIYTSDTLTSVGGTYILSVLPRVKIDSGGFFIGIRQTGTTNIAFAYQPESPVRPNAFYFAAPLGDTSWVPFSPGYDFKFNIQPRIQVANDVAVLQMNYPVSGDTIEYNQFDSIAPSARIVNYGYNDQKAPFDVICRITNQYGQQVYGDTVSITLNSNDTTTVTFDKRMSLNNYGKMYMEVFTSLYNDKVKDNDTLTAEFDIVVRFDVAVETYFDPTEGQKFELNTSRIGPVVRVVNTGASNQSNIRVTSRIRQGNQIARSQTLTTSLAGTESVILAFDSFTIPWWGDVVFETYCWGVIDSFSSNDTARVNVYVDKSYDVGIRSVTRPKAGVRYERKTQFRPYVDVRNYGVKDQDTVPVQALIMNLSGDTLYQDLTVLSVAKFSTGQALFKLFTVPDSVQTLQFQVQTLLPTDQDRSNDTIQHTFEVVTPRDLAIDSWIEPIDQRIYNSTSSFTPTVRVRNSGNYVLNNPPVVYCRFTDSKGTVLYLDSAIQESGLAIDAYDTIQFPKPFSPTLKDRYFGMIWHKWQEDGERSNDTLRMNFEISFDYSLALTSIRIPDNNAIYAYNATPIAPRFIVRNDGLKSVTTQTNFTVTINKIGGGILYQQTGVIDSIPVDQSKTISLPLAFQLNQIGTFQTTVVISNPDDDYHLDDTLRNTFTIAKNYDVAVQRIDFPTSQSVVNTAHTYSPKAIFQNLGDSSINSPFSVSFQIMNGLNMLYNQNESITLKSGESLTVHFDSSFVAPDRGTYLARAIARYGNDQEKSSDTLETSFTVVFATGVNNLVQTDLKLFPNPVQDQLMLTFISEPKRVELIDMNGKTIELTPVRYDGYYEYTTMMLSPGMYQFMVSTEQGVYVLRWMKE